MNIFEAEYRSYFSTLLYHLINQQTLRKYCFLIIIIISFYATSPLIIFGCFLSVNCLIITGFAWTSLNFVNINKTGAFDITEFFMLGIWMIVIATIHFRWLWSSHRVTTNLILLLALFTAINMILNQYNFIHKSSIWVWINFGLLLFVLFYTHYARPHLQTYLKVYQQFSRELPLLLVMHILYVYMSHAYNMKLFLDPSIFFMFFYLQYHLKLSIYNFIFYFFAHVQGPLSYYVLLVFINIVAIAHIIAGFIGLLLYFYNPMFECFLHPLPTVALGPCIFPLLYI